MCGMYDEPTGYSDTPYTATDRNDPNEDPWPYSDDLGGYPDPDCNCGHPLSIHDGGRGQCTGDRRCRCPQYRKGR